MTTTLWRFIESSVGLAFGLVSQRPRHLKEGELHVAHLILSRRMQAQIPAVDEARLFAAMHHYCAGRRGGPLGTSHIVLVNAEGVSVPLPWTLLIIGTKCSLWASRNDPQTFELSAGQKHRRMAGARLGPPCLAPAVIS